MLSLGSARWEFRSFKLRLKAQPIEPEEPVHKISLEVSVIQYLLLFLKFLLLDTKLNLIIHYKTCDALFIYNVLYRLRPAQAPNSDSGDLGQPRLRLKVLDPGLGSQLFEPMDNIIYNIFNNNY
jgi:hypothetical protein